MTSRLTFGFVGGGKMAEALVAGLVRAGLAAADDVVVAEPENARREHLRARYGVRVTADNAEAAKDRTIVVLAVKPQALAAALPSMRRGLDASASAGLIVSVVAGATLASLEAGLGEGARLARTMPNTPALVGRGATAVARGRNASDDDLALCRRLFESVGIVVEVPEDLLDAVTGLSGSGPAYVFVFAEALADAGVRVGLPRDVASKLAAQTLLGSATLLLDSGKHPGELKDQVTSPGGTTIAGLERLEAGGLRAAVYDAVRAATERSTELGKKR